MLHFFSFFILICLIPWVWLMQSWVTPNYENVMLLSEALLTCKQKERWESTFLIANEFIILNQSNTLQLWTKQWRTSFVQISPLEKILHQTWIYYHVISVNLNASCAFWLKQWTQKNMTARPHLCPRPPEVDNGSRLIKHYDGGCRTAVQHWEDLYNDMFHLYYILLWALMPTWLTSAAVLPHSRFGSNVA